jgi:hypothetical protein
MFSSLSRRDFVANTLKAGAVVGLGDFAFLKGLAPVSADEAKLSPGKVQLCPDIEALVRLIEDTPRDTLLEAVAAKLRQGLSYQELLSGLFLAGVRGIQPRPVGFKFHAVLVVNSAHLASLASPDTERWLPLFWALDNFKSSQVRNQQEGNWSMAPVEESKLPSSSQAKERFIEAMDNWDEQGADRAIAALVRTAGAAEVAELFWRYGARDFRSIGHKAIYAANSWRTLQTIGWRHAEPVMRSLAYAMLEHREPVNPAKGDAEADRPWRENLKRAGQIRAHWQTGKVTPEATTDLLKTLRTAPFAESCAHVVELLNRQVDPASLWDALFLHAGELLMRQPGIVGLHCVTSINALHFAYQASGNDETRRLVLLQAASFLPLFRKEMVRRGKMRDDLCIDTLETADVKTAGPEAVEEIFATVSRDRLAAARKALALLESKAVKPEDLMTTARRLVFNKGNDSHDYKFCSAALEDYYETTPHWRNRYLVTSLFNLRGSGDKDTTLMRRARAALEKA